MIKREEQKTSGLGRDTMLCESFQHHHQQSSPELQLEQTGNLGRHATLVQIKLKSPREEEEENPTPTAS